MLNRIVTLTFVSFLIFLTPSIAQVEYDVIDLIDMDTLKPAAWDSLYDASVIDAYDKLNPHIGGDSVRLRSNRPCAGLVKDFYPDSTLKHKGYYTAGRISTTYSNYYPDGTLERTFKLKGSRGGVLETYFPNGQLRMHVEFFKGEPIVWQEFYPNGKMEMQEAFLKDLETLENRSFYYSNGEVMQSLELVDKKKGLYISKSYFPDGQLLEEGELYIHAGEGDLRKTGYWKTFNPDGSLYAKVEYINGIAQI